MNRTHIVRDNPNIKEGIRYWKNRPEGAVEVLTQYQGAEFGITSVKSIFLPIRTFELCVPLSERTLHDPSLLHLPLAPTVPAEEKLETRKYDSLFARRYLWADSRIMCDVVVPAGKNLLLMFAKSVSNDCIVFIRAEDKTQGRIVAFGPAFPVIIVHVQLELAEILMG